MLSRHAARNLATTLLITAAGVGLGVLWAVKRQATPLPIAAAGKKPATVRVLPPSPGSWLGNEPELTAVPHAASPRLAGADDYEAISPEELSSAFLSRATESWSEIEESDVEESELNAELQGFQIATIDDLTAPKLCDDPADFEIPSGKPA